MPLYKEARVGIRSFQKDCSTVDVKIKEYKETEEQMSTDDENYTLTVTSGFLTCMDLKNINNS